MEEIHDYIITASYVLIIVGVAIGSIHYLFPNALKADIITPENDKVVQKVECAGWRPVNNLTREQRTCPATQCENIQEKPVQVQACRCERTNETLKRYCKKRVIVWEYPKPKVR